MDKKASTGHTQAARHSCTIPLDQFYIFTFTFVEPFTSIPAVTMSLDNGENSSGVVLNVHSVSTTSVIIVTFASSVLGAKGSYTGTVNIIACDAMPI